MRERLFFGAVYQPAHAARLAAEAVVFGMHMALCIALLVGLKLAVGFDLYAAFGLAP